jgi:hypothetical protein
MTTDPTLQLLARLVTAHERLAFAVERLADQATEDVDRAPAVRARAAAQLDKLRRAGRADVVRMSMTHLGADDLDGVPDERLPELLVTLAKVQRRLADPR